MFVSVLDGGRDILLLLMDASLTDGYLQQHLEHLTHWRVHFSTSPACRLERRLLRTPSMRPRLLQQSQPLRPLESRRQAGIALWKGEEGFIAVSQLRLGLALLAELTD